MKKKVVYSESYKKGVTLKKDAVIEFINSKTTEVYVLKAGKYADGKEFLTITIDNI